MYHFKHWWNFINTQDTEKLAKSSFTKRRLSIIKIVPTYFFCSSQVYEHVTILYVLFCEYWLKFLKENSDYY